MAAEVFISAFGSSDGKSHCISSKFVKQGGQVTSQG